MLLYLKTIVIFAISHFMRIVKFTTSIIITSVKKGVQSTKVFDTPSTFLLVLIDEMFRFHVISEMLHLVFGKF